MTTPTHSRAIPRHATSGSSALAAVVDLTPARGAAPGDGVRAAELAVQVAGLLPTDSAGRGEAFALAASIFDTTDPARAWPLWQRAADTADVDTRIQWLASAGHAAQRAGVWSEADRLLRSALTQARELFGGDDFRAAGVARDLAVVATRIGAFAEAATLCVDSLAAAARSGDLEFEATVCHTLGELYHAADRPTAAERWARRAVHLRSGLPPTATVRHALAADQSTLAGVLVTIGHHDEAISLLDMAEDAFTALYGADHYEIAVIDGHRARIGLATGDLAAAHRCAGTALAVGTACLGPSHPDLAPILDTLGTILRKQHRYRQARDHHRRALAVLAPAVHPGHPLIRTIIDNLLFADAAGTRVSPAVRLCGRPGSV
jgi:tetratricopeptide (TPR) repeat protein